MVLLERCYPAGLLVIEGAATVVSGFRLVRTAVLLRDEVSSFVGGAA